MKRILAAVGVAATICLLVPTSQAAGAGERPEPTPTASATPEQPGGPIKETDGCKAQEKAAQRRAVQGDDQQVCIRPSTPDEARQTQPRALERKLEDHRPKDYVPIPEWCWDHALDGWWVNREHACKISSKTAIVRQFPTWKKIGEIYFLEINYAYTDASAPTWGNQIVVDKSGGWGAIEGARVQGFAACSGQCKVGEGKFPSQLLSKEKVSYGEWLLDSTVSAGQRGNGSNVPGYYITVPGAIPSPPEFDATETIRCDDELRPSKGPGCVVPSYEPPWAVSLSGQWKNFARHVRDAQKSGLPGAYPDGEPLTRLRDRADIRRNGDRACPQEGAGGYPRPTGYSCDEYPFRSTHQGAYTQSPPPQPPAPGRTFDWCQINQLGSGTGAKGWSACMIPATENSEAGREGLRPFYEDNRVLAKDEFHVWIVE
ncbi:NucA/NucB deoxyribonuclease domain-containing protein [Streptomyces iconiensis]|uniref:Deoxyribonuclease NucA/NucB domain-containing protein n=1 Tax=Streptomyces iconiensis TaxID=1384038 RepID=A0ABT6ZZL4_9ACTN|nr:hypothetical protein [Streptomyces iconiensis]MDJ1134515.1 hypothetical protein [Streptomyces iconiensis]